MVNTTPAFSLSSVTLRRAFDMWLACHTQQEIADALNVTNQTVSDMLNKFTEIGKLSEIGKTSATFGDFKAPIYNVWKQQVKSVGVKHPRQLRALFGVCVVRRPRPLRALRSFPSSEDTALALLVVQLEAPCTTSGKARGRFPPNVKVVRAGAFKVA